MSVHAWEDRLPLKTYMLGPDDPLPPWQRTGMNAVYPYTMQDDLGKEVRELEYRALHIEDEYLHCIVLPGLGGHMYSLYDKIGCREVFYRNNVVKYGLVSRRGAWVSGGIEFNFPQGHTPVTVSPVRWALNEAEAGASITIGATDRVSRMRWSVTLSLSEGEARLRQQVSLYNPTPVRGRHYFWANSAMPAADDLRLIIPAARVRTSRGEHEYPLRDGVDLSLHRNHTAANDIFALDSTDDFFGCWYDSQNRGMVHWADHHRDFGKKYFTWGTSDAGMIWVDLLTDNDGQYVELQSGRFVDQSTFEFLRPYETAEWTEFWYPVSGISGFAHADARVAANLKLERAGALVELATNSELKAGQLSLRAGGRTLWKQQITLRPGQPLQQHVPVDAAAVSEGLELVLESPHEPPLSYRLAPGPRPRPITLYAQTPAADPPTAEQLCAQALKHEKTEDRAAARSSYEQALALDPACARAHFGLGLLDYRAGLYASAAAQLERSVGGDRDNDEAWYYLALAQLALGNMADAGEILWRLVERTPCRSEAAMMLARLAIVAGDFEGAEDAVSRAAECPGKRLVSELANRTRPAAWMERIGQWGCSTVGASAGLPHPEQRAESFLAWFEQHDAAPASDAIEALAELLGDDVEAWLELALVYADLGRPKDAGRLLIAAQAVSQRAARSPMLNYYIGFYVRDKRGDEALRIAANADPEYCFPSRLEELEILGHAIGHNPADWKARLCLGNLLACLGRRDEALATWQQAAEIDATDAVLCRNIGLATGLWLEDWKSAVTWYARAVERRPDEYHLWLEYDQALERAAATPQQRLDALAAAPYCVSERWELAARRVQCLVGLSRWDAALALMRTHTFKPWEGARQMHDLWVQALVGRARDLQAAGSLDAALADCELALTYPPNLGVGRPAGGDATAVLDLATQLKTEIGAG